MRPLRSALASWSPKGGGRTDPLAAAAVAWPAIVGKAIAENTRLLSVAGDTLVVMTRSGAWSQQLSLLVDQVLQGLHRFPELQSVARLRFRVGTIAPRRHRRASEVRAVHRPAEALQPLPDDATARDALERLRWGIVQRQRARSHCQACGAARDEPGLCGPCTTADEGRRTALLQRLMYDAPWLRYAGMASLVDGLEQEAYERCRRALLGRWWEILSRSRWTKRVTTLERRVASSYVLLQSGLEPDRVTPTVVRNLLGDELAALLDRFSQHDIP
ncbi:MAG: DUF721 domain-containing protein [Candidatus Eremiobacteraeota bacterium]|nr:DUF721 domain-containing protein [Candidatus Eremiobacteraeota bacterium]